MSSLGEDVLYKSYIFISIYTASSSVYCIFNSISAFSLPPVVFHKYLIYCIHLLCETVCFKFHAPWTFFCVWQQILVQVTYYCQPNSIQDGKISMQYMALFSLRNLLFFVNYYCLYYTWKYWKYYFSGFALLFFQQLVNSLLFFKETFCRLPKQQPPHPPKKKKNAFTY